MPLRILLLLVLCLGFACVGRASATTANNPPPVEEVEQFIATTLPGYWKVDQLSLSDPVDYGNPIEPEWRWRYEALIAPKEPLYVESGRNEGVVLLELNLSPESPRTLYGVVIATFHAGNWSGEARHENRPFDHGGQPASFFPGRTVVAGSPEEREIREATQRQALEKMEATHKAESAALNIEHQTALAIAKDAHRVALERLKAEQDAERERREAEHENKLASATARHAEQLASLEADLKAEAERRRVEITESERLTELAAEASDRLTALHAAEAEMLAASDRVHEARSVALKKLFDMFSVVTGPDDYLALLNMADESQLDWMRVAVLRHGLRSDDLAMSNAAWRHLLHADVMDNPDLKDLFIDRSISQWASEVVDFSSQYGDTDWAASQVLGKPNTLECGDFKTAWATETENSGHEFVRVRFAQSVWFPEIGVHETLAVGAIRRIILWDAEGNGTEYDVEDPLSRCPGVAEFQFDKYTKPVNELTVVLDTKAVSGWNEIDAISLSGKVLELK